eukprot:m.232619 g.232619  ORF g.232619 m.232619 type:complete len:64 (+) comp15234_c0_seq2:598-789(+)
MQQSIHTKVYCLVLLATTFIVNGIMCLSLKPSHSSLVPSPCRRLSFVVKVLVQADRKFENFQL